MKAQVIFIKPEAVLNCLNITGLEVRNVYYDHRRCCFGVVVEHPDFPEVALGGEMPTFGVIDGRPVFPR